MQIRPIWVWLFAAGVVLIATGTYSNPGILGGFLIGFAAGAWPKP